MAELKIKQLARERKITMEQVAKAAGYNRTSSYNQAVARGLKVPQLEAIAQLLGVEVPDLFDRKEATVTCPYCGKTIKIELK
jgi:transcriptional regulator with XRE-family HTH domain